MRPRALASGIVSFLPGATRFTNRRSGGTTSARYCYSVWLRHIVRAHQAGLSTDSKCVAELGPGDSFGIGLAAVLSGADSYIALDAKAHANTERNLSILEELIRLFHNRTPIPDDSEWPLTQPKLSHYGFPHQILTRDRLVASLAESRLDQVRRAIQGTPGQIRVAYRAPWTDPSVVEPSSVDFFVSQAVLEHVEDLDTTYAAMRRWMKPGASMSHSIDFWSHDLTWAWNGHWTVGDRTWRLVRGARPYLINRQPLATHLDLLQKYGFEIVFIDRRRDETPGGFRPARTFRSLTADDVSTRGAFVQAKVPSR